MQVKEFKILAEEGKYLTQSAEVEETKRIYTKTLFLGTGDISDWRDATEEEFAEHKANLEQIRLEEDRKLGLK